MSAPIELSAIACGAIKRPLRAFGLLAGLLCLGVLLYGPVRHWLQAFPGRWSYLLLFSFLVSVILTPLSKVLGVRTGAVDWPDRRKSHEHPTPRLGGVAVFAGIIGALWMNGLWEPKIARILTCAGLLFCLEVAEDMVGIPAPLRLLGQVAVALYLVQAGVVLNLVAVETLPWSIFNACITVLWLVGITNAFNFFDGLDGLASGLAIIISVFLGTIAFHTGQAGVGWVSVSVLGAALGFLPYNFKPRSPAEVFLGDGGSTVLGFILAGVAVHGEWSVGHPLLNLSAPLLIFGVLIYDMCHVTASRIARGDVRNFLQWLETPGRDHMHHRLEALLKSKRSSVLMILLLCFCLCLIAIVIRQVTLPLALVLLLQSLLILILVSLLEKAGNAQERRLQGTVSDKGKGKAKGLNGR